jgi:hypothetical protein
MDHDDREMPGGDGHLVLHVHLPSRDAPRVGNLGASGGAGQAVRLPDGAADEEAALRLDAQRAMRVDRLGRAARGNKQPAQQEKCCPRQQSARRVLSVILLLPSPGALETFRLHTKPCYEKWH